MERTKRNLHDSLVQRHQELSTQLAALKAERSAVLSSGGEFPEGAKITSLSEEIPALADAIAVAEQYAHAEQSREDAAQRAEKLTGDSKQLIELHAGCVRDAQEAHEAVKSLVQALTNYQAKCSEIDKIAFPIAGAHFAILQEQNIAHRLSDRIMRGLSKISRGAQEHGVYGNFRWPPQQSREENWGEEEDLVIEGVQKHLQRLLSAEIEKQQAIADAE